MKEWALLVKGSILTIVSTHSYFQGGIKKGHSAKHLYSLMSKAHKLECYDIPYVHSIYHLAMLSRLPVHLLHSFTDRKSIHYTSYSIPKRSGGCRFLHAPSDELKSAQRWINDKILSQLPVHSSCYSYHSKGSILECAQKHCSSKWLIKLDIENFFDEISEVDVYKVFRTIGYKPMVAFILARICTYEPYTVRNNKHSWVQYNKNSDDLPYGKKHIKLFGRVPQGAPTSPMLSNLVLYKLDEKLSHFAQSRGGIYSRYADDLFISFGSDDFDRTKASQVIGSCLSSVRSYGYKLNRTKIKVVPPGSNKVVLGLNVNGDEVRLTKTYKKKIESHIYGIKKFGIDKHALHRGFDSVFSMIDHIIGLINHAKRVEPEFGADKHVEFQRILTNLGLG
ncbi:RNA-directed DNA polymerase [Vibrio parahaemolyticus]|uniref:reverse transcriptase family protein n=1 Tax=Vibrio parahaemolyticus TaxID=670 RepID=UPI0009A97D48|nr:RNA-directed DNA polymerase [Vibrio parahaemolyticus]